MIGPHKNCNIYLFDECQLIVKPFFMFICYFSILVLKQRKPERERKIMKQTSNYREQNDDYWGRVGGMGYIGDGV